MEIKSTQVEQMLLSRLAQREVTELMHQYLVPYKELMAYYRCAMMEVSAKFNVLNEELSLQYDRNPIENIRTRLKTPESIAKKLQKIVDKINIYDKSGEIQATNFLDPLDIIDQYGCDVLRYSLLFGSRLDRDPNYGDEKITKARHFMNKIWMFFFLAGIIF